jgi:hypothetical protein
MLPQRSMATNGSYQKRKSLSFCCEHVIKPEMSSQSRDTVAIARCNLQQTAAVLFQQISMQHHWNLKSGLPGINNLQVF